jgi:endonuclease YncB( thermonuclease family)
MNMLEALVIAAVTISVVDGDTVRYEGETPRIENIDTGEIGYGIAAPGCISERLLGELAAERLEQIVEGGVDIRFTGEVGGLGRPLVRLEKAGHDVGELLIEEGYALPWTGERVDWCSPSEE